MSMIEYEPYLALCPGLSALPSPGLSVYRFRKKLEKLGKQKGCELVCEWQKSIINHLYWCVSSSSNDDNDDNSELIKAKWLSLDNHVHNVHKKHSKEFPKCLHGRLRSRDKKKKWFKRRKWNLLI